ncbi:MAG: hypothetical protein IJP49_06480 [Bacteroidales bacterium]|nr:hypothetical protein [Bacteroidales bacterium]
MKRSIFCLALLLMVFSCAEKQPVTTGVSQVDEGTATLYGQVAKEHLTTLKEVGFFVSTTENFEASQTREYRSPEVGGDGAFATVVKGLRPQTTYYYKAFVRVNATSLVGEMSSFTTEDFSEPMHAVDLGLSVKWCSCNLDAAYPEDFGGYYSWGAISEYSKTEYVRARRKGDGPELDIASIKLGGTWKTPTDAQWTELRKKCTWTWTSQKGVNGYLVTSNSTGNSIFLPAAGFWKGRTLVDAGTGGVYWSQTAGGYEIGDENDLWYPQAAWRINFDSSGVYRGSSGTEQGRTIRPVCK